ncbi:MAG: PEP-CTERM system TPR-repeat protein PrsT [Burkholderiaceae bacterium]|nr:PEP-CTERM system TPR-repeat protein PrsT [Burkholderiaceae bacterium]
MLRALTVDALPAAAGQGRRHCAARPAAAALRVSVLVIAVALAGCGDPVARKLDKARELLAQKQRPAAIVEIKSLLQDQPDLGDARLLLGTALLDAGDPVAAEIELRRALALGIAEPRVVPLLARALLAQGQPAKLIAQYGNLAWPDAAATAALKTAVAEAEATEGDLAAARASVEQALRALPDHEPALRVQVRLTAVAGDLGAALDQVEALLKIHPDSAEAWVLKGDLLARRQAAPATVMAAYRQALAVRPDHAAAHGALIALQLAQGEREAAQTQFLALQKVAPKHPLTLLFEGQLAVLKGDLPRARELFQALHRAAPDNLALLQSAGLVELRLNAPVQAEALLSKALQIAPEAASTRRLLAQCHLQLGQPDRALAVLAPLIEREPADAEALALAAQARLLAGQPDQATALFERAARLQPDDPKIRTAAALAQLARGNTEAALVELRAVAEADSGIGADMALIAAQLRRRDFGEALKAVAVLERKQPDRPMPAHLRGQVLLLQRDPAGARLAFEQALQRDPRYVPAVASLAAMDVGAGRPEQAKARFEALLKLDPANGPARQALAELAARSGADRDAVAALLEEAVKAGPDDIARRLALIDHHLATYNARAAVVAAQTALARFPDAFDLLGRLGQAQLQAAEYQQALGSFGRMVALQGKSPLGYLGQAEAQLASNEPAAALRSARRALEVAPGHLGSQRLAITAALRAGQRQPALAIAREVQQQRPGKAIGFVLEAEIEMTHQRWDAAVTLLRKALTLAEPGQAPERLHQALRAAGRSADADALASRWRQEHPRDIAFLFYLADTATKASDPAAAERHYQDLLALDPSHALALNNLAWLLLQQKRPGALALAERAVRAAPYNPALLDTLALAYAADNQPARAIEVQTRAQAMLPDDPYLRLNLARFYAQAGEKRKAKAELDRLAALGERFPKQDEVAALTKGLGGRQP